MTVVLDKVTDVQDQIVSVLASTKEPVTKGVTAVVDFVTSNVSTVPALPFADLLPTPQELVNSQYRFVKQIIDTQKDVALSVAKAVAPLTNQLLDRKVVVKPLVSTPKAPVARKTSARKTTARRSTARKTAARKG